MKSINKNVAKIKVIVTRPNWECIIDDLPVANDYAESSELSERCNSYVGENDEYKVTVYADLNETKVEVSDKKGAPVDDDNIQIQEID